MSIEELESFLSQEGLVLKAIPFENVCILPIECMSKFPNGTIEFVPEYGKEMLILRTKNKYGGMFVVGRKNKFSGVSFEGADYAPSIPEAVRIFQKNH